MKRIILCLFLMAGMLAGCSSEPAETETVERELQKYTLLLEVESEGNWFFSTYDIDLYVDNDYIGTVGNGDTFSKAVQVLEGEHRIIAKRSDEPKPTNDETVTVDQNLKFSCKLSHDRDSIGFRSVEKETLYAETDMIEMIDVNGQVLSDAKQKLKKAGFKDVTDEPSGRIWDEDNWRVISQNIEAGEKIYSSETVVLTCEHFDDYYSSLFVGKTIEEIQTIAKDNHIAVKYQDNKGNDCTSKLASADETTRKKSVCNYARKDSSDYTALLTIDLRVTPDLPEIQHVETTPKPETTKPDQSSADKKDSLSYTTNDSKTAKEGNTGVYAYKSSGGTYDNYWIIDFDEGYVYWFSEGNDTNYGDRVRIQSGDLNEYVLITYHDGSDVWSYGLHFKWKNQPDILILQEEDGYEYQFYPTDLEDALNLKKKKIFTDF